MLCPEKRYHGYEMVIIAQAIADCKKRTLTKDGCRKLENSLRPMIEDIELYSFLTLLLRTYMVDEITVSESMVRPCRWNMLVLLSRYQGCRKGRFARIWWNWDPDEMFRIYPGVNRLFPPLWHCWHCVVNFVRQSKQFGLIEVLYLDPN
jgi:hypothetical protein